MEKEGYSNCFMGVATDQGRAGPTDCKSVANEEVNSRAASQVLSVGKREEFACDLLKLAG